MPNPEIENATTVYSMIIDNHRFPAVYFYIDPKRYGHVIVKENSLITLIDIAFESTKIKKNYHCFEVWDCSRGFRTIWHLRLIRKEKVKYEDNECTGYFFRYDYTNLERLICKALTRIEANFLTQVPIDNFLVDFLIEPNIIIEADGPIHESDEQQKRDRNKDRILRSKGFRIERISDIRLWISMDTDIEEFYNILDTRIKIILAKKNIKSESQERFQEYINKEAELRSYVDDELQIYTEEENSED